MCFCHLGQIVQNISYRRLGKTLLLLQNKNNVSVVVSSGSDLLVAIVVEILMFKKVMCNFGNS